jgi:hypothetical protein
MSRIKPQLAAQAVEASSKAINRNISDLNDNYLSVGD